MTDPEGTEERADRDLERSEEAHWQVAEAGAEEEELEAAREAVARDREPKQTSE